MKGELKILPTRLRPECSSINKSGIDKWLNYKSNGNFNILKMKWLNARLSQILEKIMAGDNLDKVLKVPEVNKTSINVSSNSSPKEIIGLTNKKMKLRTNSKQHKGKLIL